MPDDAEQVPSEASRPETDEIVRLRERIADLEAEVRRLERFAIFG